RRRRRGRSRAATAGIMDIAADASHGSAFCRNRPCLLAQDSEHRPVQLLLHALPHAAVSFLRRLLSPERAPPGTLAVGRRDPPLAASCASRARGVPWGALAPRAVGSDLHPGRLGAIALLGAPRHRPAAHELTGNFSIGPERG